MLIDTEKRKKELLFPHEEVRKNQENLILDIEQTIKEKKRLVADAPTGLGKTVSALGPALSYAIKNNLTVWFLTNRHTQHTLAVETLKLMQEKWGAKVSCADLIGKRWMCNQEVKDLYANEFQEFCKAIVRKNECQFLNSVKVKNKLTVEAKKLIGELIKKGTVHNDELITICKKKEMCGYEISLELGKKANVIIGDYYYLFNPFIQQNIFGKLDKELEKTILIVDEAHNLPNRIVEMLSHRLTDNMLKNAVLEAKKYDQEKIAEIMEQINGVLNELKTSGGNERLVTKDEFLTRIKKITPYAELVEELEVIGDEVRKKKRRSYIGGVASFLESWLGDDEGYTRIIGERYTKYGPMTYLSYDCLDPSLVTKEIFSKVHSAILMSGTLKPTFMYNDILGVDAIEKSYTNPFPPENKLTLIVPETTTKYSLRSDEMYQRIGSKCSDMLNLIRGNCAIFFPSYALRDSVCTHLTTTKKTFWEKREMNKTEKEEFLERFKAQKETGGVLLGVMGGSFGEGVDLPGDQLNGVVVVGVPLSKPTLKTKEIIKYFDEKFDKGWEYGYLFPAMSKCFQSAGRCIRSAEDKGTVIYLDERFAWQTYFRCFPRENVIVRKDFEPFLKEFFQ
ncbi:ATP-dependent DNA helicase [Candidatus Woesearchaeota archaeon]|nr:ATP-dependent DNA helicase [Candidatus Woesearchaeota archaeon]